jgi:hypothetical protein
VGAALALAGGDPRGLLILALGAVGGWAAGRALAARPNPVPAREPPLAEPHVSTGSAARIEPPPPSSAAAAVAANHTLTCGAIAPPAAVNDASGAAPTAPGALTGVGGPAPNREAEPGGKSVPVPAGVPAPARETERVPVATGVMRAGGAAPEPAATLPVRASAPDVAPPREAPSPYPDAPPEPGLADGPSGADASFEASTKLPNEVRLQDLAERQRSSTADLRRSIRDVIERLEDEEPPPSRRRGKKPRR